jgi:hypothetical protein
MARIATCLFCAALAILPAYAGTPPAPTLEDVQAAVKEHWSGVRDLTVEDHVTQVEYRQIGPLPLPKTEKTSLSTRPNRWMAAPGLEYLELWQGDKCAKVAFDGTVTRWEGQRNAFAGPRGRICAGNNVPMADLTFTYYVARFGQYSGLVHFLDAPDTRLVKANKRIDDILCHRVRGMVTMDIEGTDKPYEVTLDLAPQYGWLPVRAEFVDPATGQPVRGYRVRSFFNLDTFPFPREAQIDHYRMAAAAGTRPSGRAVLTTSLVCNVDRVAVNQGLSPGDFVIAFGPGTEVRDKRTGEVHVVPNEEQPKP